MANGRLERQEKASDGALVGVPKRRLERLEGGFGVFACGVGVAKKAFGGFGGFEAWQAAGLNAKKKLLMWPAGLGVPKRHLERLEGGFGVFACGVGGAKKAFGGFGGFEAWQTAGLNAKKKLLIKSY